MNDFDPTPSVRSENIRNRRSHRRFLPHPVPPEDLDAIISAGLIAPSSKNRQPWRIHVVEGVMKDDMVGSMTARIERLLSEADDPDIDIQDYRSALVTMRAMSEAPVLIVVCYEDRRPYPGVSKVRWDSGMTDREMVDMLSIGACIENMTLEATERGLGSLWIGDFLYALDELKEATGIDGNIVSVLALGHVDSDPSGKHLRRQGLVSPPGLNG